MAEQSRTDSKPLVFVDNRECHLRLPRLREDVAPGGDDRSAPIFIGYGNQRDVIQEIDVDEKVSLLLRKAALGAEEATIERFGADPPGCAGERTPIFRPESPNFD